LAKGGQRTGIPVDGPEGELVAGDHVAHVPPRPQVLVEGKGILQQ